MLLKNRMKVSWWDRNEKVIKEFGCDLWIIVRKLLYQPNESVPRKGKKANLGNRLTTVSLGKQPTKHKMWRWAHLGEETSRSDAMSFLQNGNFADSRHCSVVPMNGDS